jgi:predicted nucleotidyltransferase
MNNDTSQFRPASRRRRSNQSRGPSPSVAEPRQPLLLAALSFVRAARACQGVQRISLLGSMLTAKAIPKDVDVLVTIDNAMDLTRLARAGRRLMGFAQTINLGADVFLADATGCYLGRICHYRECHPRVLCQAQHCGQRDHLNDDLHIVTLSQQLIACPPVDLWPRLLRRITVPVDVENILLTELERDLQGCPSSGEERT